MGKILIIADMQDSCFATPRGLQLAEKLGQGVDVVAFTYAPLKRLKVNAEEQGIIRKRLMTEREQSVQARIDKYKLPGQKVPHPPRQRTAETSLRRSSQSAITL